MKEIRESRLKFTKAIAAAAGAISAGLVFFEVMTMEQLTGLVTAFGAVFAFVYTKEGRMKNDKGE